MAGLAVVVVGVGVTLAMTLGRDAPVAAPPASPLAPIEAVAPSVVEAVPVETVLAEVDSPVAPAPPASEDVEAEPVAVAARAPAPTAAAPVRPTPATAAPVVVVPEPAPPIVVTLPPEPEPAPAGPPPTSARPTVVDPDAPIVTRPQNLD